MSKLPDRDAYITGFRTRMDNTVAAMRTNRIDDTAIRASLTTRFTAALADPYANGASIADEVDAAIARAQQATP